MRRKGGHTRAEVVDAVLAVTRTGSTGLSTSLIRCLSLKVPTVQKVTNIERTIHKMAC